jgi:riboflavin synthase
MFTGITTEIGSIIATASSRLTVGAPQTARGLAVGASVAVNGVCLTVTEFDNASFKVDIMPETLGRTNLGQLRAGDRVNLERALVLGGELGGHLVQGHIDDVGRVVSVTEVAGARLVGFEAPPEVMRYIVTKGFVAIDGISLTVVDRDDKSFRVSVVEHTRQHTTIGERRVGAVVNLEVDIIAKYVERMMRPKSSGLSVDTLREHGFL